MDRWEIDLRGDNVKRFLIGTCGLLSAMALVPAAAPAATREYASQAYQILAAGSNGAVGAKGFNANSTDQGILYDDLTPLLGTVSAAALKSHYLSEKFGVSGPIVTTEKTGRKGLTIVRGADGFRTSSQIIVALSHSEWAGLPPKTAACCSALGSGQRL